MARTPQAAAGRGGGKLGAQAAGIQADAGVVADLDRMFAEIETQKGKLDGVFAYAGIYERMPHDRVTEDFFEKTFDIHVKGVYSTIQKVLPLMNADASILWNGSSSEVQASRA